MELPNNDLLSKLDALQRENEDLRGQIHSFLVRDGEKSTNKVIKGTSDDITLNEYKRYGRQMIVKEFGSLQSQLKLKSSRILVIGAGGLGSPVLLYLVGAGVGTVGIVDDDVVDISNLHRQVLHSTDTIGLPKCQSTELKLSNLNPHVQVETYPVRLTNDNVFDIIEKYDLILDCTDTPATRYLINDASVLLKKTVVSGSGLRSDGQISIFNFQNFGPCYRCFYPSAPSPESVTSCSDGGVIGPAIGLIGVSMSLEAIKVLTGYYTVDNFKPFLLSYTGYPTQQLRSFKMRPRNKDCVVCGLHPVISRSSIVDGEIDYVAFCGRVDHNVLDDKYRVSVEDFSKLDSDKIALIDVRPAVQYGITKLPNSLNIPWDPTFKKTDCIKEYLPHDVDEKSNIYVVCRYGNDSQLATKKLVTEFGFENVKDVKGGLNRWSEVVDNTFPRY